MEVVKQLTKKIVTKEVILYIVFGILTTVVNIGTFWLFTKICHWNENVSNLLAILLAILVAYLTNKDLVFHSKAKNAKEKMQEFLKFILGRAFTLIVELLGGYILFKTAIPEMISKIFLTVVVIILNFFISKFFAFRNKK